MRRKIHPTPDQEAMLCLRPGPVWEDKCGHGLESYVCSFELFNPETLATRVYDFYLDDDYETLCFRCGNNANYPETPFYAPSTIESMRDYIRSAQEEGGGDVERLLVYEHALRIVDAFALPEVGEEPTTPPPQVPF